MSNVCCIVRKLKSEITWDFAIKSFSFVEALKIKKKPNNCFLLQKLVKQPNKALCFVKEMYWNTLGKVSRNAEKQECFSCYHSATKTISINSAFMPITNCFQADKDWYVGYTQKKSEENNEVILCTDCWQIHWSHLQASEDQTISKWWNCYSPRKCSRHELGLPPQVF